MLKSIILNIFKILNKIEIFFSKQQLIALLLDLMPLFQSLVPQACKKGIKSKARAIKSAKKKLLTNEWRNIPFYNKNIQYNKTQTFSHFSRRRLYLKEPATVPN